MNVVPPSVISTSTSSGGGEVPSHAHTAALPYVSSENRRMSHTGNPSIVSRTPDELLSAKNFGVTSLNEIRQKLAEIGLKLRND